ncbi:Helix-turn-helix [Roseovarius pacificus]|uniref:Helix-turn-helix n=1 Tax=Roseovarius pacificus TaxID=337701 RepID=A0A1M6YJZ5_9RHOB|nr:helix-turn-helix transcriptional regulator [Roseovarius pacificus]GGO50766.1 XRE family transcriptional regulator [Roseovarius pacificus]SHL18443.1 Helix-turn-helix [Roseovarius pacificus]
MMQNTDKRLRADLFRTRLSEAIRERDTNQSALARAVGVDRSTISQLLKGEGARLPNAQVVGECARALGVSADWLLGLTDRPETAADILRTTMSLTEAPRALVDEQIFQWHKEAAGYKIRHVPAGLSDMLKTREMLEWEYTPHLGRSTQQAIGASEDRMDWMRGTQSDYEIAMPLFEVYSLARGEGYYAGLPYELRKAQIERMIDVTQQLYPRLRIYLYDARRLFSAPVTIFGPLLAVVYIGQNYMAFRDTERVQALTQHFDHLVREAHVSARQLPDHLHELWQDAAESSIKHNS